VLIIQGGTNDMRGGGVSAATAYASLLSLVSAAVAVHPWTVVVQSIPPGNYHGTDAGFNAKRDAYNALLDANWRSFAQGYSPTHLDFRTGQSGDETNTTYFLTDLLHKTDAGYAIDAQYAAAGVGSAIYPGGTANVKRPHPRTIGD
jgi:hypothetical protein